MFTDVGLLLFISLFVCLYIFHRWHFSFWQRRKLPCIPTWPIVGNVKDLILGRCCFGEQFNDLYNHPTAKNQAFVGIHVLFNRALLIRDPELIKCVLVKNFSAFSNRFETTDSEGDSMGSLNLFFAKYGDWKEMHGIFSPFFATNRVKLMYPLIVDIALKLEQHMAQLKHDSNTNSVIIEVKEMSALYTTDTIASLAFGIEANSLQNPNAEFRQMCIEVNDPRPKRLVHLFVMFFFPSLANFVGTHLFSAEYEKFMRKTMDFVIKQRSEYNVKRGDLIDAFIDLMQDESLPKNSVVHKRDFFAAHAAFLLLAGFDTSSSTITFALYELAQHIDLQNKLREEICEALRDTKDGTIAYEDMPKLTFLDCVVKEVLRLYPPTAFLDRCCGLEQSYNVPSHTSTMKIPKGMPVYISVLGLQRDAKYWPKPDEFIPTRFTPENAKLHTPMTYLPFGAGPRGCIGSLLGLIEVKLGLIHILKNYRVELCEKTKIPIKYDAKAFVLATEGGTYLRFVKDLML